MNDKVFDLHAIVVIQLHFLLKYNTWSQRIPGQKFVEVLSGIFMLAFFVLNESMYTYSTWWNSCLIQVLLEKSSN